MKMAGCVAVPEALLRGASIFKKTSLHGYFLPMRFDTFAGGDDGCHTI